VQEQQIKEVAAKTDVPGTFLGAVFGDNATVVIGNDNTVKVHNIKKGDFDALAKLLIGRDVSKDDVDELKAAVAADEGKVDVGLVLT